MKTTHKIIFGDSRNMSEVEDESIHLIVTSPPYWQLKDYGSDNQIGFNDTYEDYINNLNLVWSECYRVLHKGCRLCVNIGDQFARAVSYGRYKVIPIREEIIKFCEIIGFDYMGAIIWQKVTTTNTSGGGVQMGSYPYPRNGIIKIDYEFILIFKKLGDSPKPSKEQKEKSKMTPDEWNKYFAGHWNFAGAKQDKHIAMFPEELPSRLIKMFSFVGENILDPFAGSGTTALASKNLYRNSIGYEINSEYADIIKEKIGVAQRDLNDTEYEFITQNPLDINFEDKISKLPYIFSDPHSFNNKINLKKTTYGRPVDPPLQGESLAEATMAGSKIDSNNIAREEYLTVKEIISPECIKLNNNITIRLVGVKENSATSEMAKSFLRDKTKGKKVFLKYDKDIDNNLFCYLYLENKTFINAHLIKSGLVLVDESINYKYKDKFKILYQTKKNI